MQGHCLSYHPIRPCNPVARPNPAWRLHLSHPATGALSLTGGCAVAGRNPARRLPCERFCLCIRCIQPMQANLSRQLRSRGIWAKKNTDWKLPRCAANVPFKGGIPMRCFSLAWIIGCTMTITDYFIFHGASSGFFIFQPSIGLISQTISSYRESIPDAFD